MMSRFAVACRALLAAFAFFAPHAASAQAPRPNVVLILADDLGYSDLGCFGSEIKTPHLDAIAKSGVAFTQFYNQARCCPTRATLMTGRWPHQVGIGDMIDAYAKPARDRANRASYDDHLSTKSPTMPELLRAAGYRTMMSGKWHLGYRWAEWPFARGFDRSFALIGGAMNYYGGGTGGPRVPMAEDDKWFVPPRDGFFSTDAFADKAVAYLNEAKQTPDTPFFLYLAFNAPHWPLHASPDDIAAYDGVYDGGFQDVRAARLKRMTDLGVLPAGGTMAPMDRGDARPWDKMPDANRRDWAERMRVYAAQVTHMDRQVGRVLAELDRLGVADDTVVLFLSDNGGAAEDPGRGKPDAVLGTRDSFRGYDRPWASVSNTPWRLHKTTCYEGGVSTPLLVRWPNGIDKTRAGTVVRSPGHVIDLLPTVLGLAGAAYPETPDRRPEGHSLLPVLNGRPDPAERVYFWEHEGNRGVRAGPWKLERLRGADAWQLYDIDADRVESRDVVADRPDVAARLTKAYDDWAARVGVFPDARRDPATKGDRP